MVMLRQTLTGEIDHSLRHSAVPTALAFTPDCKTLAIGGRDGDEPPSDPITDCLRIGCHIAAVGNRTDELRHRIFGRSLGAEPALGLLPTPAGRGVTANVDDVCPALSASVHMTTHEAMLAIR